MSSDGSLLWIEILSRHDAVLARDRVQCGHGQEIRIGRGYDNDVVLDDPFIAPRHLRIVREADGSLVVEDLGSANGMFVDQDRRRAARAVIDGRRTIRIGRTRLRVRQAGDAVAAERIEHARKQLWPIAAALALAVLGTELLTMWLRATTEQQVTDYVAPLLGICAVVAVWAAVWAVMSRIFSGRARFQRHLVIALFGVLALWVVNELTSHAAFALSQRAFVAYRYVVLWLLAAFICFLHLRQLSSREAARAHLKLKATAVIMVALGAIGMQALSQWESSRNSDRQVFLRELKPPALRLARSDTPAAFLARIERLKGELDESRAQPPSAFWYYAGDDEE